MLNAWSSLLLMLARPKAPRVVSNRILFMCLELMNTLKLQECNPTGGQVARLGWWGAFCTV